MGSVAGRDIKLAGKEVDKSVRIDKHKQYKKKTAAADTEASKTVTGDQLDDDQDKVDQIFTKIKLGQENPDIVYHNSRRKRSKLVLEIDPSNIVE